MQTEQIVSKIYPETNITTIFSHNLNNDEKKDVLSQLTYLDKHFINRYVRIDREKKDVIIFVIINYPGIFSNYFRYIKQIIEIIITNSSNSYNIKYIYVYLIHNQENFSEFIYSSLLNTNYVEYSLYQNGVNSQILSKTSNNKLFETNLSCNRFDIKVIYIICQNVICENTINRKIQNNIKSLSIISK